MRNQLSPKLFLILFTWIIAAGCLCTPGGIRQQTSPATPTVFSPGEPVLPPQNTPTPAETSPQTQVESPPQAGALASQAPWLIIHTEGGLWAANMDGSGLQKLAGQDAWGTNKLENALQPHGNNIVYISSKDNYFTNDLTLNLLSFPDGKVNKISALTNPNTEPSGGNIDPGSPQIMAIRAISDNNSFAWSPDGLYLAFIGVNDGPSAELYTYETRNGAITRQTTDDAQDYSPAWSPDGENILVFGADSFGTGAGYSMKGVWKVAPFGSGVSFLYEPKSSGEELIDWVDESNALLSSWNMICGSGNLRIYDLISGKETLLYEECYRAAAANRLGWVLYATEEGLFTYQQGTTQPTKILSDKVNRITWLPQGGVYSVYFEDGGLATFSPDGQSRQDAPVNVDPSRLNVASYGMIWAWTSADENTPGVWISGPGMDIGKIFDQNAASPLWDKNNNLYFISHNPNSNDDLYRASFPAYNDVTKIAEIDEVVSGLHLLGE